MNILAIPGSLRADSSSNLILRAAEAMMPSDVIIDVYNGVATLPHFNDAVDAPEEVVSFRQRIKRADAVLICTPEYAFGIPGSLKNALDWTVGSGEFMDKPVALITASSQGDKGHAAMLLVLQAISARVVPEATLLISFVRSKLDAAGNISDPNVASEVKRVLDTLIRSSENQ